ncbi:MAG: ABC transporter permease, partial [Candidatus Bathyarchaeales archaeon]
MNSPVEIEENETYISDDSPFADEFTVGEPIQVNISVFLSYESEPVNIPINLTVKGLAQLDEKAHSIAGYVYWIRPIMETVEFSKPREGLLIVSWEKTIRKILDEAQRLKPSTRPIETNVLIYLDRNSLITPWDIDSSINNVKTLEYNIENKLAALGPGISVQNNLEWPLNTFRFTSMMVRFTFTLVSLPIFFMAWYMGTIVSTVSFNLRRREIGLLLTKGFSRGQILRIFLTETMIIGMIGGVLGVFLGFLLNPLFTQFSPDALFNPQMISPYTMIFTVAFGIIIALFSMFSSAKKASQLPTVDALREYLPLEEIKPYKKRWPWVAFILGTYKIIVFILGINMTMELSRVIWSGNFILILLTMIFLFIDSILNYIGPLLFFWGFTKLFIQGSLKFQELTAKAAKFLGDLGVLATKNVRRNPARSAAIAFLIALIVGYSVQVTGQLASEQDYAIRQIYYQVGADAAVHVAYADEAPEILNTLMANVSEHIQNVTIEYSFSASLPTGTGIRVKAVEPQSWLKAAYYEGGWFSGNDVATAFNNMAADENTIILERSVAKLLNLEVGQSITIRFGSFTKTLDIVGFFGPEPIEQQPPIGTWRIGYWYT